MSEIKGGFRDCNYTSSTLLAFFEVIIAPVVVNMSV